MFLHKLRYAIVIEAIMWLVGQMLQFQQHHLFRAFFFYKWHHVPCALWCLLSSLPHQFSIFEDVGGWQLWPCCYRLGPWEKALTFFSKFNLLEMGYPIFLFERGGGMSIVLLTLSNVYYFFNQFQTRWTRSFGKVAADIKAQSSLEVLYWHGILQLPCTHNHLKKHTGKSWMVCVFNPWSPNIDLQILQSIGGRSPPPPPPTFVE